MITYSPYSKYTAQKIQDKVSRGAYFYSKFEIAETPDIDLEKIINKLTDRYHLKLSSRQRTYRLSRGEPIADLIVQKKLHADIWLFIILITTPNSHQYSKYNGRKDLSESAKKNISNLEPLLNEELMLIKCHFNDSEEFKSVLVSPFMIMKLGVYECELVRLPHKKYSDKSNRNYRKPSKEFSWTWRFTAKSMKIQKDELVLQINRYVSMKDKHDPICELYDWHSDMYVYAVFRGMRKQAGSLYAYGKKVLYSRIKKKWDDIEELPQLYLTIIMRHPTYADSYAEYRMRRTVYEKERMEIPREVSQTLDWSMVEEYFRKQMEA